jgi:hypothetical protein
LRSIILGSTAVSVAAAPKTFTRNKASTEGQVKRFFPMSAPMPAFAMTRSKPPHASSIRWIACTVAPVSPTSSATGSMVPPAFFASSANSRRASSRRAHA